MTQRTAQPTPLLRGVEYARISFDDAARGFGVERQHVDCAAKAAQEGIEIVVPPFIDNDRSASRRKRKVRERFEEMMETVRAGGIDAIVCHKLDRFSRMPIELEQLILAAEGGIKIVTATGNLDLSTRTGVLQARLLMAIAADESEAVSERTTDKLRHDAMTGSPHWVRRPFGYNRPERAGAGATLHEIEAPMLANMYAWLIDDGLSLSRIALRMNASGVPQPSGKAWQAGGVKMLLRSARNAGRREYNGADVGEGLWPAIIDAGRLADAVSAIATRSAGITRGSRSAFTGIVRCADCGLVMHRVVSKGVRHFRCTPRTGGLGCNQSIMANPIETKLRDWTIEMLPNVLAPVVVRSSVGGEQSELERVEAQLLEINAMRVAEEMSGVEWKAMREPLVARRKALAAAIARSDVSTALGRLSAAAGNVATLADRWDSIDADLLRRLISTVIDRVEIHRPAYRGDRSGAGRVEYRFIGADV